MSWFRDRKLEARVKELAGAVDALQMEIAELRAACTMRVGDETVFYGWRNDHRPVLTAMQAIQKLMDHAGIEPKPVKPVRAGVDFVPAKPPNGTFL